MSTAINRLLMTLLMLIIIRINNNKISSLFPYAWRIAINLNKANSIIAVDNITLNSNPTPSPMINTNNAVTQNFYSNSNSTIITTTRNNSQLCSKCILISLKNTPKNYWEKLSRQIPWINTTIPNKEKVRVNVNPQEMSNNFRNQIL